MSLLTLLIRLAPLLIGAAVGVALGYFALDYIPAAARPYLLIPFLVIFLAMIVLDAEPGWNVALFLAFALAAGMILRWTGVDPIRGWVWALFLGLVGVSLLGAALLGEGYQRVLRSLFLVTILYLLGWLLLALVKLPPLFRGFWILAGLALFTLLAAGIFLKGRSLKREESPVPLAIEVFVVLYNLFWLAGLVSF